MPLERGKSEKVFSHNVREMMEHGHPQKQSLAAAYSMRRKRMADGGSVASGACDEHGTAGCRECNNDDDMVPADVADGAYARGGMIDRIMDKRFPGEVESTEEGEEAHEPDGPSVEEPEPESERDDMIGRIMKKRMGGK